MTMAAYQDARYRTKEWLDRYLNILELAHCDGVLCDWVWILGESPTACPKCGNASFTTYYNLTEDDGTTTPSFMTAFGDPLYSIVRVFIDKEIDLVYSIGEPNSDPMLAANLTTWGYQEHVPIKTFCIDKTGITGVKLKWKAEQELRLICEQYFEGSLRHLTNRRDNDQWVGPTRLYSTSWTLNYRRYLI